MRDTNFYLFLHIVEEQKCLGSESEKNYLPSMQ